MDTVSLLLDVVCLLSLLASLAILCVWYVIGKVIEAPDNDNQEYTVESQGRKQHEEV